MLFRLVRIYFHIPFSIFASRLSFLICESYLSSHSGFNFLTIVFRVAPIFYWLILLLRILNRLNPWFCLLGYLSISRSLSWFQTWLSSSLASWERAMLFSFQTWFFSWFLNLFFLLMSVFASLCLHCISRYHLVFDLYFLYLVPRLLHQVSVDVLADIFVGWFPRSENQLFIVIVLTWSACL